MKDIADRVRELADKWRYSQMEASEICRDAAEEIRVLRAELKALKSKGMTEYANHFTLGWGKGKDE
jgi:hypothetical protein